VTVASIAQAQVDRSEGREGRVIRLVTDLIFCFFFLFLFFILFLFFFPRPPQRAAHGLTTWEFDLTYLIIRGLKLVGLATDVKGPEKELKVLPVFGPMPLVS